MQAVYDELPQILARGVEWYKAAGANGSRGLKFVGVSGHVARPGVYEIPMGTPVREVIYGKAGGIRGGRALKAFAPLAKDPAFAKKLADAATDARALIDELDGLADRTADRLHVILEKHKADLAAADRAAEAASKKREQAHADHEAAIVQREMAVQTREDAVRAKEAAFKRKMDAFSSAA